MSKMKNVAKIEIVLHDPYSNALWGGGLVKKLFLHYFPFKTITHRGRKYICLIKTNFDQIRFPVEFIFANIQTL